MVLNEFILRKFELNKVLILENQKIIIYLNEYLKIRNENSQILENSDFIGYSTLFSLKILTINCFTLLDKKSKSSLFKTFNIVNENKKELRELRHLDDEVALKLDKLEKRLNNLLEDDIFIHIKNLRDKKYAHLDDVIIEKKISLQEIINFANGLANIYLDLKLLILNIHEFIGKVCEIPEIYTIYNRYSKILNLTNSVLKEDPNHVLANDLRVILKSNV